ncbi:MAG TPA: suppressor of fused domain protein [Pyrinomonadaceae bacterium]|nr:suppressor of fused domain protein [Pyrinomonadaceae bacterium]
MDNSSEPLDFSQLPDVSDEYPDPDPEEQLIAVSAAHGLARYNALQHIFGKTHPEDSVLEPKDQDLFLNWIGGAALCFPPQRDRKSWYYVTHGLAQPIEEDDYMPALLEDYLDYRDMNNEEPISGWGIELVISTQDFYGWAPDLLMSLVKYLLFNENSEMILTGHRLPLGSPIASAAEPGLNHLLAVTSPEYPTNIRLPGGLCSLIHVVGVTEAEVERARTLEGPRGSLALQRVLEKLGVGCVTDPDRSCVTTHPQFDQAWQEAESNV